MTPSIVSDSLIGTANTISELQVTFSEPIMVSSFLPANVFFYNPSNQQVAATSVVLVAGSNNTEFDIFFPTQTAAGVYSEDRPRNLRPGLDQNGGLPDGRSPHQCALHHFSAT